MKKLTLMILTIILMSSCMTPAPIDSTEYSYFTYIDSTLYECSRSQINHSLIDCVSLNGTKIDAIYNATYFVRKR